MIGGIHESNRSANEIDITVDGMVVCCVASVKGKEILFQCDRIKGWALIDLLIDAKGNFSSVEQAYVYGKIRAVPKQNVGWPEIYAMQQKLMARPSSKRVPRGLVTA